MESELSIEDREFLAKCEEELKDRYTDKDEEFMKVFNRPHSTPPILEKYWLSSYNFGRRNPRNNRRFNDHDLQNRQASSYDRRDSHGRPYDRQDRRHHPYRRDRQEGNDSGRGYNDYNSYGRFSY